MLFHGQKDIFRFYVSVHNVISVQILDGETNLFNMTQFFQIGKTIIFLFGLKAFDQTVQLPIRTVFHNHVKFRPLLKEPP